ncbi:hypothetical protein AC579_5440 [Pseudocercospora musae]|uniref:Origin recognition complex subunit 3 winged helix C-terminal domain-containing protein n=1 Tax=Pseudocercospora musae TaxID=113226 RepID=A0A139HJD6_9PEZI|nr:hypothetical protein AC579_5440 [Pseudocercospora musae]
MPDAYTRHSTALIDGMMEYEKCYVFQPVIDDRPAKRRRLHNRGLQSSWQWRKPAYRNVWHSKREQIDARLDVINATTVTDIAQFLDDSENFTQQHKIPTALVLAGANSALRSSIFAQVPLQPGFKARRTLVSISSGTGTNLKNLLKSIIQKATLRATDDDEDEVEEGTTSRRGTKLLNYDLQILCDHVEERQLRQIVIAFEDTEAFDNDLLSELVTLLAYWQDRIPFAFLFNIATSVEFLQQRLSNEAVRCLGGRIFDAVVSSDETEKVFDALVDAGTALWLGPNLISSVLDRQGDYVQGIDSLRDAAQYAYMSQHYANATTLFLNSELLFNAVPSDHFEALRTLPSFRRYAEELLGQGETKHLRQLLDFDRALFDFTKQSVEVGRTKIANALMVCQVIRQIQQQVPYTKVSSKSGLYIQMMSAKLAGSPLLRSLLLSIKKLPSDIALKVMAAVRESAFPESLGSEVSALETELASLVGNNDGAQQQPLRSEDDLQNSTLRTTVVAQKVELSKQKSTLSKQDAAYTALVRRFADALKTHFAHVLINPKELPMNEIFLYDFRSPYREVFTPRPRHAVERALAAPHDYLNCECCAPDQESEEATLAATQPATAVLYQLYLESGNIINVSDLWQAFQAVIGESLEGEAAAMALYQRAMAELKYLGLVKATRKKVDHVAKVAWRDL